VGLPALRMTGIYLAIATLAFAVIIQEVFSRWESVTHGFAGMRWPSPSSSACPSRTTGRLYYLCLFFLVLALWLTRNSCARHRPRLDRHPRQRDRRPVDGRQPGDLQVDGLRLLGGA